MKAMLKVTGFTLIEVLIAMGILAIGLLGLLTLQGIAMKSNSNTLYSSQAANLANSIVDAMRANKTQAASYITDIDSTPVCTTPLIILDESIAEQDVAAWRNSIACTLPQGTGGIELNAATVTVTVQWNNSRNQTEAEQSSEQDPIQKFTMKTNL